jgi:hypothetical protein
MDADVAGSWVAMRGVNEPLAAQLSVSSSSFAPPPASRSAQSLTRISL